MNIQHYLRILKQNKIKKKNLRKLSLTNYKDFKFSLNKMMMMNGQRQAIRKKIHS